MPYEQLRTPMRKRINPERYSLGL